MLQDFFDQFQAASLMFAKFNLAALQNSLILQEIFLHCESTNSQAYFAIAGKRSQFILITPPKNKEVLSALDTIRRRLQCEGEDMDTFFRLEKQLQESIQNNIKQTTIAKYFT